MSEELPVSPLDCEDDTDCSPGEGQSGLAIRRNISGKSWSLFFDKNVAGGTGQPFFTGRGKSKDLWGRQGQKFYGWFLTKQDSVSTMQKCGWTNYYSGLVCVLGHLRHADKPKNTRPKNRVILELAFS